MATDLHNFWCHQCKKWQDSDQDDDQDGGEFFCLACEETILCDECGQPWNFTTEHEHAIAKQSRG